MVTIRDKVAFCPIATQQVVGLLETAWYGLSTVPAVAKNTFASIQVSYHSRKGHTEEFWTAKIKLTKTSKELSETLWALVKAILTAVIPFYGIIRYYKAKDQDAIVILLANREDRPTRVQELEAASKKGSLEADLQLYTIFEKAGNTVKAKDHLLKASNGGLAEAQKKLGLHLENGDLGLDKDLAKAVHLYTLAALQGNTDAQYNLALCYDLGDGVEKDPFVANFWYKQNIEKDIDSKIAYCKNLLSGTGVKIDPENVYSLVRFIQDQDKLSDSQKQGLGEIYKNLAKCYIRGKLVPRNFEKALEMREKAKAMGQNPVQAGYNLPALNVCAENPVDALNMLDKAWNQGCVCLEMGPLLFEIAESIGQGRNCTKDAAKAHELKTLAIQLGYNK